MRCTGSTTESTMSDGRTPEPTAKDYVGDVREPFSTAEADRCTEVVEMLTDQYGHAH
jgi:hypothetical protein